jgi:hypothetical protein
MQMIDEPVNDELMTVYLDVLANTPKTDAARFNFKHVLRLKFDERVEDSVERIWELPPIILREPGPYVELLLESRELFIAGYFYSCVAMCGIVAERLLKDLLRTSILIRRDDHIPTLPSEEAFDQLERVEMSGIVNFLNKAGLLQDKEKKAANGLGELRNQYAHARGKNPHADATKAIKLLYVLVEGTVSVFKDFEIKDGRFVRKGSTSAPNS